MISWKVKYYNSINDLYEISSNEMNWDDLPKNNVISVEITNGKYKHRLSGMDNYWVSGNEYGVFNNTGELGAIEEQNRIINGHEQTVYEGLQALKYSWENVDEHLFLGEIFPNLDIYYIEGIMIPDDEARQLGLI